MIYHWSDYCYGQLGLYLTGQSEGLEGWELIHAVLGCTHTIL